MSFSDIIIPALVLVGMGAIFGIILSIALKRLHVPKDEKIELISAALPGANCGACGEAGCAAYAARVVSGSVAINLCTVGGDPVGHAIAEIMGVEFQDVLEKRAVVHCQGGNSVTVKKYDYEGPASCKAASMLSGGGFKVCSYGCLGLGDCMSVCQFNAITMSSDGLPVIDRKKCTGCGMCARTCPKSIISMIDDYRDVYVKCSNHEKAPTMKKGCSVGCIACTLCITKACKIEFEGSTVTDSAMKMDNFLAVIDYSTCTDCGRCPVVCPQKVIEPKVLKS